MLSTPKCGWSNITIGDWSDRCSYLTDVPFQLLEALEQSCREHKPVSAKFDAEGWEYIITFDWWHTHIVSDRAPFDEENGFKYYSIEVNRDDLARELVEDIRRDIDGWSNWDYGNMSEDEIDERKKDLLVLCDIVEKRLPSDDLVCVYSKLDFDKVQFSDNHPTTEEALRDVEQFSWNDIALKICNEFGIAWDKNATQATLNGKPVTSEDLFNAFNNKR